MPIKKAAHGGSFFSAIGEDFSSLGKSRSVISADVLDAWFDPSPRVIKKIRSFLPFLIRTSPPTHCHGLIRTISSRRGIPVENIMVAGGSSDIIFKLFPRIVSSKDNVLVLDPMYAEYGHILAHVLGADITLHKLVKEAGFKIDVQELLGHINLTKPKIVIMVNPNSPTGQHLCKRDVLYLLSRIPKDTLLVLDETYIDYVNQKESMETEVAKKSNLVVIKSMSKAYALSGVRVAYMVGSRNLVEDISKITPPWVVSLVGQVAAVEALKDEDYYSAKYKETHKLRESLSKELRKISSIVVYDSCANFFLVELTHDKIRAKQLVKELQKNDIFVRECSSISHQLKNFVRISVKDGRTNKLISTEMKKILS